ncbi:DUF1059 domain-containing protein [Bdellovibrionota bacterium FG-2]
MKTLLCKDMGMDSTWRTQANTEAEILRLAADHAREKHNMKELTPEMQAKVCAKIRELKVA